MPEHMQTVSTAGGLGDMLIVLCKLSSENKRTGAKFRLVRHDLHAQYDGAVDSLVKAAPFAEYERPSRISGTLPELYSAIAASPYPYIDTKWLKTKMETYPFDYNALSPFLTLNLPEPEIDRSRLNLGVQLYCGMPGHNFRGFSPKWLTGLRKHFPNGKYNIWLFSGDYSGYDKTAIERICAAHNITDRTGQLDFHEWMAHIAAMDCFISLEGFSALFAATQKVRTLIYNQYAHGIGNSIHPEWLKKTTLLNINTNPLTRKLRRLFLPRNLYNPKVPKSFLKENAPYA